MEGLHGSGDQRQGHRELPHRRGSPYNNPYNIAQKNKLGKKVEEEKDEDGESREKDVNSAPSAVGKTFEEAIQILNGYKAGYIEEYSDTVPEAR